MKNKIIGNRRTFLKSAAIFGGAILSLSAGRSPFAAASERLAPPAKELKSGGYRLTEHIKRYYETANL